ncbi:MAG: glycosyltransferase family 4 protein, partial [Candidatus Omnitrophica bacterium]|nr:glycosyltransferase family 4 protein [Candidatus Omnitrophota bacterium]
MKILMVHPHDLFSPEEPWAVRVRMFAVEFVKQGYRVTIIYFPLAASPKSAFTDSAGIEYIPLSRKTGVISFLRNLACFYRAAGGAALIHFQKCFYHASLPALCAAYARNIPVHYDWDDWELQIFLDRPDKLRCRSTLWLPAFFLSLLEALLPRLCETVSVSSESLRHLALRRGVRPERLVKAPVGADIDKFHPRVSGMRIRERYCIDLPLLLYVGQLHGSQYAELFIRAAKIIVTKDGPVKCMVVGTGSRLSELKRLVTQLGLEEYVIFTGAVPHDEVPLYIAAADIVVACFQDNRITRSKSPLKIVEYLAGGKPIVASGIGEVKYMLGGAGVITKPGDVEDLAGGIRALLNNVPLRQRLSAAARRRAEQLFTWRHTAEALLRIYIFAGGGGSAP